MHTSTLRHEKGTEGFTLVEILVVIVILAILAVIVVFAVGPAIDAGRSKAKSSDARILSGAEDAFFANGNTSRYATETELWAAGFLHQVSTLNSFCVDLSYTNGDYFVVDGAPATQAVGDAACAAAAAAFSPPKTGTFVASAGSPAVP